MATVTLPPIALVRQLLHYDPDTGMFKWLPRPHLAGVSGWNRRFAGNSAGWIGSNRCLCLTINYASFRAHRLAWLWVHGEPVPDLIDHIDGDTLNNRIGNLRAATKAQNAANSAKTKASSGVRGVEVAPKGKGPVRFRARIGYHQKTIYLGTFDTIEEAKRAYEEATIRLYGQFARTTQAQP